MTRLIPTEISPESLKKFKEIYFNKFHYYLSDEQAEAEGLRLLRLVVALIENIEVGIDINNHSMLE